MLVGAAEAVAASTKDPFLVAAHRRSWGEGLGTVVAVITIVTVREAPGDVT